MTPFDLALDYLFKNEGNAFVNDPDDAGGPTKFGVTLRAWSEFTGDDSIGPFDIEALTIESVKPFYRKLYWEPLLADRIVNVNIAVALFDTAVLYGVVTTILFAQHALNLDRNGQLKEDGVIGEKTLAALNAADRHLFLESFYYFILHRIDRIIREDARNEKFRAGWINRARRLLLTLNRDAVFTVTA